MTKANLNTSWETRLLEEKCLWLAGACIRRTVHPKLTSGKHGDSFFNGGFLEGSPFLLNQVAMAFRSPLQSAGVDFDSIDYVVGPAQGGVLLAHAVAWAISLERGRLCRSAYLEKEGSELTLRRSHIEPGTTTLVVDDAITDGTSIAKAITFLETHGAHVLPVLACIVHWSPGQSVAGRSVVSLVSRLMGRWDSTCCIFCKTGSKPLPPKRGDNWSQFVCDT